MGVDERRPLGKDIAIKGASQVVRATHLMIIHTSSFHGTLEGIVLCQ